MTIDGYDSLYTSRLQQSQQTEVSTIYFHSYILDRFIPFFGFRPLLVFSRKSVFKPIFLRFFLSISSPFFKGCKSKRFNLNGGVII